MSDDEIIEVLFSNHPKPFFGLRTWGNLNNIEISISQAESIISTLKTAEIIETKDEVSQAFSMKFNQGKLSQIIKDHLTWHGYKEYMENEKNKKGKPHINIEGVDGSIINFGNQSRSAISSGAESLINQPTNPPMEAKKKTAIELVWDIISKNALISAIIAGLIVLWVTLSVTHQKP